MLPGPRHMGSLPCGSYQGSKEPILLRVRPIPNQFPTNILNTPMNNPLHYGVMPVGQAAVFVETWRLGPLEKGFPSKR